MKEIQSDSTKPFKVTIKLEITDEQRKEIDHHLGGKGGDGSGRATLKQILDLHGMYLEDTPLEGLISWGIKP